ncbi:hypothetical protein B566_EDAN011580 [Ephemera danica]|nr:hypothetical protein B566_EDAN011580 [Ephemera danica]
MLSLERIPDQVGYLVLTEDGAVVASSGELENNERLAKHVTELVHMSEIFATGVQSQDDKYNKITVTYDDYTLGICLSNKRIHVVKRRISDPEANSSLIL